LAADDWLVLALVEDVAEDEEEATDPNRDGANITDDLSVCGDWSALDEELVAEPVVVDTSGWLLAAVGGELVFEKGFWGWAEFVVRKHGVCGAGGWVEAVDRITDSCLTADWLSINSSTISMAFGSDFSSKFLAKTWEQSSRDLSGNTSDLWSSIRISSSPEDIVRCELSYLARNCYSVGHCPG
jgi:hypothetical protein